MGKKRVAPLMAATKPGRRTSLFEGSPTSEALAPAGAVPSFRTVSLPKEEFEKQIGSGLWRISVSARAGGTPAQQCMLSSCNEEAAASPAAMALNLERPSRTGPPPPAKRSDPPRSIIGLPVISCRNWRYSLWVLTILVLDLTYSAFLLPLSIGFQVNDLDWSWACCVDLVAGAFFAVELVLGFHVSYYASNAGQQREIRGGRAVARYYLLHGSFRQDAISTAIWLTQIVLLLVHQAGGVPMRASSSAFQYIRIIRMVRFIFVVRQLAVLTVGSGAGSLIPGMRVPPRLAHMLNVTYSVLVLLHFIACLWNFLAIKQGLHGTWLNPIPALVRLHSADGTSVLTAEELAAVNPAERYVTGLYFAVVTIATLGYGDIVPTNTLEYLINCCVIAVGVLVFGLAMGSLAEMVSSSSKEARQAQLFREKMEGVNAFLHSQSIPRPLKHKIRAYYSDVWLRHAAANTSNIAEQFQELPHALRHEVAWELNRKLLTRLSLFRDLDDEQRSVIAGMLLPVDPTPGQELCLHGDPSDRFWLLHEGELQVFDECGIVSVVCAPAVVGVEALLQHVDLACAVRPFGYRTSTVCTLWEAHLEDLLPFLLDNTAVLDALSSRAQRLREAQLEAIAARQGFAMMPAAAAADDVADPPAGAALGVGDGHGGEGHGGGVDGGAVPAFHLHGTQGEQPDPHAGEGDEAAPQQHGAQWTGSGASASVASCSTSGGSADTVDPPQFGGSLPASSSSDAEVGATKGEVQRLREEVVRRLDDLAAEMRRAAAAASLAAAAGGRSTMAHGSPAVGAGGRIRRAALRSESHGGQLRRMHWSYGQFSW